MISTIKNFLPLTDDQVADLIQIEMNKDRESLYVAVLGQFSVGKSSLINVLLNRPKLLPTKLTETTAILTEICADERDYTRIDFHNGASKEMLISDIYTYIHGSEKLENIEKISVYLQDTKLPNRVTLIDTPGSNVIYSEHHKMTQQTIATAEYAIYVIASAALSDQDITNLKQILKYQPNLVLVINHMDRLLNPDEGESLLDIIDGVESDLVSQLGIRPDIFPVSAKTMMGIQELQDYLFNHLVEKYDSLRNEATSERLYHLLSDIKVQLEKELELLRLQQEQGQQGLQHEQKKLLAQQQKTEAILNREHNELTNNWDEIRNRKEKKISLLQSIWKDRIQNEKDNIRSCEDIEHLLQKETNELERDKQLFIDDTIHEFKERAKSDFAILTAELESIEMDSRLTVVTPNYAKIERKQEEEMAAYLSQIVELREEYQSIQEQYQEGGHDEELEQQMVSLQNQLAHLNEGLNIPYEPVFIDKENTNTGFFAAIGKNIGRTADWTSTLIPVFGATKLGQNIAKQGLKTALKEVGKETIKQTAKEMTQIATKKMANPKEFVKMIPKEKNSALKLLEMTDLEGWGTKIGNSLDHFTGNNTPKKVEDEEHRIQFIQKKNELEFITMNHLRDMKKLQDQARTKEEELKYLKQLEGKKKQLLQENEQKLEEFEQEVNRKRAQFEKEHWQEQYLILASSFIEEVIESLNSWLTIQRSYIMKSSQIGLRTHFDEEFSHLNTQIDALQEKGEAANQEIASKIEQVTNQLAQCEELLAEVSHEERIIMA